MTSDGERDEDQEKDDTMSDDEVIEIDEYDTGDYKIISQTNHQFRVFKSKQIKNANDAEYSNFCCRYEIIGLVETWAIYEKTGNSRIYHTK